MRIDYDGNWKELIQREPEYFIAFFLEDIYDDIDFKVPPICLIQDVAKVIKTTKQKGDLVSDIIMKVQLKNGETRYLYIHIEVQSSSEDNFGVKMFNPFYRIRDKYQQDVTALALFVGDTVPKEYDHYEYQFGRTKVRYEFPYYICKDQDEAELKESKNPFAIAVLACMYLTKTKKSRNFEDRLEMKKDLVDFIEKEAKRHNFSDETIAYIYSFVVNIMILPKQQTEKFYIHFRKNILKLDDMNQMTLSPEMKRLYDAITQEAFNFPSIEELIKSHKIRLEKERKAKEKERIAKEKAKENERIAKEKAKENERIAREKAKETEAAKEKERIAILKLYKNAKFSIAEIANTLSVDEIYVNKIIKENEDKEK